MNHNDDNNDHDKDLEELEKPIKAKDNKRIGLLFGFYLHDNFGIHILLTTIINLIVGGVVVGLSGITYKVVEINSLVAYIFVFLFFTLLEVSIKTLLIRFIWKIIIQSLGLILFIVNVLFFLLIEKMVNNFSFLNNPSNIFIFTTFFMAFRILLISAFRRLNLIGDKKRWQLEMLELKRLQKT